MTTSSVPGIAYPRDLAGLAGDLAGLGLVPLGRKVPYILAQSAVPVCLAPNGTVATNGIVTLGTAIPTTYAGGIWLRLPAGAVSGGAAGLYWAVMSSTTQGQVYTAFVDTASPFTPYIPTGLVAAVGSNAAYTQTTAADVTLANVTVPGGALGSTGALRVAAVLSLNGTTTAKTTKLKLAGSEWYGATNQGTAYNAQRVIAELRNRSSQSAQVGQWGSIAASASLAGVPSPNLFLGVDTSTANQLVVSEQLATATDCIVLEGFTIEVLPS